MKISQILLLLLVLTAQVLYIATRLYSVSDIIGMSHGVLPVGAVHFYCVATKPHSRLDRMLQVFEQKNETLNVLEMGSKVKVGWGAHAFGLKIKALYDFIHSTNVSSDDLVVGFDAYDVAYTGSTEEIKSRYIAMNKPVVFGAETKNSPDLKREYPQANLQEYFPFLNSGLLVGKVWALRELMEGYVFNPKEDDQRYWTTKYLERPDLIVLDHHNVLFLNCYRIHMQNLLNINGTATYEGAHPLFIHGNGPSKHCLKNFD